MRYAVAMVFTVEDGEGPDAAYDTVVNTVGDALHDNTAGVVDAYAKDALELPQGRGPFSIPVVVCDGRVIS